MGKKKAGGLEKNLVLSGIFYQLPSSPLRKGAPGTRGGTVALAECKGKSLAFIFLRLGPCRRVVTGGTCSPRTWGTIEGGLRPRCGEMSKSALELMKHTPCGLLIEGSACHEKNQCIFRKTISVPT